VTILTTAKQHAKIAEAVGGENAPWNEGLWTYLFASILATSPRREEHLRLLCGEAVDPHGRVDAWFEAQPMPPRGGHRGFSEKNSKIDLALGDIKRRGRPEGSGIAYAKRAGSWVCFVEAKLLSDCSTTVTHDPLRNQLTRVIESLLCFQGAGGAFPENIYFTLLTPRFLQRVENRGSRLYGYKMCEYKNSATLRRDIESCKIPKRDEVGWRYPDLEQRLRALKLKWVAYEDFFDIEPGLEGLDLVEMAMSARIAPAVAARLELLRADASARALQQRRG
jgi:hypothetical protein